ncbi:Protein CBG21762 [Caenorhabditis briggsae]|uniref:Protein CBG21762 n=1 Tax=Caenorhabditis briggsae TaxID=6238 RepID=A8Y0J6_CAEBR|nr:Protein CBG21762 [Caenorhabditis briggsae]CAP38414.1 Protein CBG21762 [Caenorhabditis briggsae]
MLNGSADATEGLLLLGNDLMVMKSTTEMKDRTLEHFFIISGVHTTRGKRHLELSSPRESTTYQKTVFTEEPAGCSGMQSLPNDPIRSRRSVQDNQYIPIPLQSMPNRTFDVINSYGAATKH